ncbi:hypothetical protein GWI33_005998 [Rhynchophorus ferrugineus]|uniref:Uncharacterized protein n=1 Tax=Rhynchophorus ferrugineus TaxID=354439 RepID=A0A834J061_RHYFE|nr:hypothetical protein GWI33_005998 [Rhynchophorus ferrugineus]
MCLHFHKPFKDSFQDVTDCCTIIRLQFSRLWHGKKRRTNVYNVPKKLITFPFKDKGIVLVLSKQIRPAC